MIIVRLLLGAAVSTLICIEVQGEYLNFARYYSNVAAGFFSGLLSLLLYVHGKWAFFIERHNGSASKKWRLFEVLVLPSSLAYMFTLPFAGIHVFTLEFFLSILVCIVLLGDTNHDISNYLWERRPKDYQKFPDSGEVSWRTLSEKKQLCVVTFFGLPAGIYLFSKLYQF